MQPGANTTGRICCGPETGRPDYSLTLGGLVAAGSGLNVNQADREGVVAIDSIEL